MNEKITSIYKSRIMYALNNTRLETLTAHQLAQFSGINEVSETCPATRGIIRELIADGELIGSTSKGYHVMKEGKEVQQCLNSLLRRQMGITSRIQAIYDAATAKGIL
jgi:hypothetical protein